LVYGDGVIACITRNAVCRLICVKVFLVIENEVH